MPTENRNKIAIVGMSCLFPQSPDLETFWQNIVGHRDCLRDVSDMEWSADHYYDPQAREFGKIYAKRGGFVSEFANFDPLQFGVMPSTVSGGDPDQFIALKVASEALADARYQDGSVDKSRVEIVLGRTSAPGAGSINLIQHSHTVTQMVDVIKTLHPEYGEEELNAVEEALRASLRPCNSDTIPAVMPNVLAGRIAGRFGFKGRNLLLDAACASSLIAVETAIRDLQAGICDMAIAGGMHINSSACFHQMFCGLGALSRNDQIRPFDDSADGTLLGEGMGMVVLKRLDDAVKNGDRIYAVVIGIGSSSDGHGTSMLAPSVEGEALALRRAYEEAGVSPRTVALVEAHGTATPSGDVAEVKTIQEVFGESDAPWCAIGSVKSQIGHCQAASGIAGFIKTALALHHRILPGTINVSKPNSKIDWKKAPVYINTQSRPWLHPTIHPEHGEEVRAKLRAENESPRRAAVSAFGFGGVNAHAVLEEFPIADESKLESVLTKWDSEVCLFAAETKEELIGKIDEVVAYLDSTPDASLKDVAYTLALGATSADGAPISNRHLLSVVAHSVPDLIEKLFIAKQSDTPRDGIYFNTSPEIANGKLAFLLPGLGAAYPNMLSELSMHFPYVRSVFDFVDQLAILNGEKVLPSSRIFPPPTTSSNESSATLAQLDSAVIIVLLAEWSIYSLLKNIGVQADAFMGISTGEFAALTMSGAVDILDAAQLFYRLSTNLSSSIPKEKLLNLRSLQIFDQYERVAPILLRQDGELYLGADLSPSQLIVTGSKQAISTLIATLEEEKINFVPLPAAIPYHTPLVKGIINPDSEEIKALPIRPAQREAWCCSSVAPYPSDPDQIRQVTADLFTHPIQLRKTIQSLYKEGVRKFVEVGPKSTVTQLVGEILGDQPHLAMASNMQSRSSLTQLNHLIASLHTAGVPLQLDYIFVRRQPKLLNFAAPVEPKAKKRLNLCYPVVSLPDNLELPEYEFAHEANRRGDATHRQEAESELDGEDAVVAAYLDATNSFHKRLMNLQEEVMTAFLETASDEPERQEYPERRFPIGTNMPTFLRRANIQQHDGSVVANLTLTLDEDRYLLDHAIGGVVTTNGAERVHLLPLTVALEMMSQVASVAVSGMRVVSLTNIRAHKRIRVGQEGMALSLRAESLSQNSVYVEIVGTDHEPGNKPLMCCEVHFDFDYPQPPSFVPPNSGMNPSRIPPAQLYAPGHMFHGPSMQSVEKILAVGERHILATVQLKKAEDWFASLQGEAPSWLIDPLTLDNCTQPVLFHLFEHNYPITGLLPFIVNSIEFYDDLPSMEGQLQVAAHLASISNVGTEADINLLDANGTVVARFDAIQSRRIGLDDSWQKLVANPASGIIGQQMTDIESATDSSCTIVRAEDLPSDEVTLQWCLDYILSPDEITHFNTAFSNAKVRKEWLLGRIAAKEAVRKLMSGRTLCPADVRIANTPEGMPFVLPIPGVSSVPVISISHKVDTAIAIASDADKARTIGIDIEKGSQKHDRLEEFLLSDQEQRLLNAEPSENKDRALMQIWTAKESCGKALGTGLSNNPKSLEMHALKLATENKPGSTLVSRGETHIEAKCFLAGEWIISTALIPVVAASHAAHRVASGHK